jgi:hypothetical protein
MKEGYLIVDDTTLDKPYSKKIGFVRYQWSGKHHRTVKGIGLVTLLWTDGQKILPVDFRVYNIDEDEKTKNDHFLDMLDKAEERGFKPKFVMFDISCFRQVDIKIHSIFLLISFFSELLKFN